MAADFHGVPFSPTATHNAERCVECIPRMLEEGNEPHWLSCDVLRRFEDVLQLHSPLNSYHGPIDQ